MQVDSQQFKAKKRETQDPPSQPEGGAPDLIGLAYARAAHPMLTTG